MWILCSLSAGLSGPCKNRAEGSHHPNSGGRKSPFPSPTHPGWSFLGLYRERGKYFRNHQELEKSRILMLLLTQTSFYALHKCITWSIFLLWSIFIHSPVKWVWLINLKDWNGAATAELLAVVLMLSLPFACYTGFPKERELPISLGTASLNLHYWIKRHADCQRKLIYYNVNERKGFSCMLVRVNIMNFHLLKEMQMTRSKDQVFPSGVTIPGSL